MIRTASHYAGEEKQGVHKIAKNEPKVVDLEIAFRRDGDPDKKSTAPRMDLAILIPWKTGEARLVFCEAKCANNLPVKALVKQIRGYEAFIHDNTNDLRVAYIEVCRTLKTLHGPRGSRKLDDLVHHVADEKVLLSIHPNVYLLVFGFDADQKKGALKKKRAKLGAESFLGNRIIAKGNPGAFSLGKDIVDCLSTTRPKSGSGVPTSIGALSA
jgi:hypothetical protein